MSSWLKIWSRIRGSDHSAVGALASYPQAARRRDRRLRLRHARSLPRRHDCDSGIHPPHGRGTGGVGQRDHRSGPDHSGDRTGALRAALLPVDGPRTRAGIRPRNRTALRPAFQQHTDPDVGLRFGDPDGPRGERRGGGAVRIFPRGIPRAQHHRIAPADGSAGAHGRIERDASCASRSRRLDAPSQGRHALRSRDRGASDHLRRPPKHGCRRQRCIGAAAGPGCRAGKRGAASRDADAVCPCPEDGSDRPPCRRDCPRFQHTTCSQ